MFKYSKRENGSRIVRLFAEESYCAGIFGYNFLLEYLEGIRSYQRYGLLAFLDRSMGMSEVAPSSQDI